MGEGVGVLRALKRGDFGWGGAQKVKRRLGGSLWEAIWWAGSVYVGRQMGVACARGPSAEQSDEGGVEMSRKRSHRAQLDHYSRRAQSEGFRARSVYKLDEIDKKVGLLRPGMRVLDLGCAPGSWSRYAGLRVGAKGRVVGIDLQAVSPLDLPQVQLFQGDAFELDVAAFAEGDTFDVVLSDMAPATTGHRWSDHVRSVALCERALEVAQRRLRVGGAFVCKIFEGEDAQPFFEKVRGLFERAQRLKPKSTRSESVEFFIIGQGLKAQSTAAESTEASAAAESAEASAAEEA